MITTIENTIHSVTYIGGLKGDLRVDVMRSGCMVRNKLGESVHDGYSLDIWNNSNHLSGLSMYRRKKELSDIAAERMKLYGKMVLQRLLKIPLVSVPMGSSKSTLHMIVDCENTKFGKIAKVVRTRKWKGVSRSIFFRLEELTPLTEPAISKLMEYRDSL